MYSTPIAHTPSIPGPGSQPPPSSAAKTPRATARTVEEKIQSVLDCISTNGLNLASFLFYLFRVEEKHPTKDDLTAIDPFARVPQSFQAHRSDKQRRSVNSLLNGTSKPHLGAILVEIFRGSGSASGVDPDDELFDGTRHVSTIPHARSAIAMFSLSIVTVLVKKEAERMIARDTGLHLRAQVKEGGRGSRVEELVTWDDVEKFSFERMQKIAEKNAPMLWNVLARFTGVTDGDGEGRTIKYRPKDLVCTNTVMALTFARSNRANYTAMCRSIWMFSALVPKTMFRVESRLGLGIAYSTTEKALISMSKAKGKDLRGITKDAMDKHLWVVSDNVQAYKRTRDHRLGKLSTMVKGMAATAIEMDNVGPEVFNLEALLERQAANERRKVTTDTILDDINWTHLQLVASFQFISVLITHVPALSRYRQVLGKFSNEKLKKFDRPKNYRSKVHPLATTSADEMKPQELKQALEDFAATQLGINDETIRNRCWPFSGDGKTFDAFLRLRKQSSPEEGVFSSFRWMVPLIEFWHAKWTDLSRVIRGHYGDPNDPCSLACLGQLANCPKPKDLRKVDFYDGQHLVNLVFDALVVNIWEQEFKTSDLVSYFESLGNDIPSFESLLQKATRLSGSHASSQAYTATSQPSQTDRAPEMPTGSEWQSSTGSPSHSTSTAPLGEDENHDTSRNIIPDPDPLPTPTADNTRQSDLGAANVVLFLRDAIWWREVCVAVAEGDTGRILEMFKVWIFTFAGSNNPFYSTFMLETYCQFKYEFSPELKHTLMFYWLVNLSGLPGCYIELDLLQEHFNFWLEEVVQKKGKNFDDKFYRDVVAMNVHHFLRLKDEMEQTVQLKARSKRHTDPHLNNELQILLAHIRTHELNKYRSGRTYSSKIKDDFSAGLEIVDGGKLKLFIARTSEYAKRLRAHGYGPPVNEGDEDYESLDCVLEQLGLEDDSEDLDDDPVSPRPQMISVDGEICV